MTWAVAAVEEQVREGLGLPGMGDGRVLRRLGSAGSTAVLAFTKARNHNMIIYEGAFIWHWKLGVCLPKYNFVRFAYTANIYRIQKHTFA